MSYKEEFKLETNTIWDFPDRGNWGTHDGNYRGNWSPYIPKNLILRYTKKGDTILDNFVGGGTTLAEAKSLGRNAIGIDVNDKAINRCLDKCKFISEASSEINICKGDARNLEMLKDNSIDLICSHPPYANIIKYSEEIKADLSLLDVEEFLYEMNSVAQESFRVLKQNKNCAVLIGDMRKKGYIVPLGFNIMNIYINSGFKLKEIIIKEQHNCKSNGKWNDKSIKYNFYLLAHEYLFIFRK